MNSIKFTILSLLGLVAILSCEALHIPCGRNLQKISRVGARRYSHSMLLDSNAATSHIPSSTLLRGHPVERSDSLDITSLQTNKKRNFKLNSVLATMATGLVAGSLFLSQPAFASTIVDVASLKATDSGFIQSLLLILVSEIGDKTFFIAALLAAKYGRLVSFVGSMGALIVMTVISTILGQIFHAVPSSLTQGIPFDDYVAIAAFAYFGLKSLYDASQMTDSNEGMDEELAEAEEAVNEMSADQKRNSFVALLVQVFTLVFAAEIGDKSFLSTIALSAVLNPVAVTVGAIGGHGIATGIAVIGGSLMSKYLSEKVVGYIGGAFFLIFAVTTALGVF